MKEMKKASIITMILLGLTFMVNAQQKEESTSQKVILITLDGFRWQELFSGIDEELLNHEKYTSIQEELKKSFWRNNSKDRREVLMPFVWRTIAQIGQIHGNRDFGSQVNLTNKHWFSYPGYNEILSGNADDERIDSNSKTPNPNTTVLEIVNEDSRYKGKVAAFTSWDVFPFIINESRSGVPVNAGFELASGNDLTKNEQYLNKLQKVTPSPWSTVRLDVFTHHYALEYLKKEESNLVYISYGETDDFAHNGDYDAYIKSANTTDNFIKELWNFTENNSFYKGKTTFIITTDHGRGTSPLDTWRDHGSDIVGANEVWLMMFGYGVKPQGEITTTKKLYSNQIAATIANILGVNINNAGQPFDID